MKLFQKLKRWTITRFYRDSSTDRNHQRVVSSQLEYDQLPSSFFQAVNSVRLEAGYDTLPVISRDSSKRIKKQSFFNRQSSSPSRHRRFSDPFQCPPINQYHLPPGTPIKYRRTPVSSDFLKRQSSSPNFINEQSLPSFPPIHPQSQWFQPQPMEFLYWLNFFLPLIRTPSINRKE